MNTFTRTVSVLGLLLAPLAARAQTTPVALPAAADTYAESDAPDTAFGTRTSVQVKAGTATRIAYFKFDLSPLAGREGQILSATLRLYGRNTGTTYIAYDTAYPVADTSWTEAGLTWDNRPALGKGVGTCLCYARLGYSEWDATGYINAQREAGKTVVCLAVQMDNDPASSDYNSYNSREAPAHPPELRVSAAPLPSLNVNFQPDSPTVPTGFAEDFGLPFDAARGQGWVREETIGLPKHTALDLTANTRLRTQAGVDPLQNTALLMQYPADTTAYPDPPGHPVPSRRPGAWEITVPNGTYSVTVGVGDVQSGKGYDSVNTLNVEGVRAIDGFVGTDAKPYAQGTAVATVQDRRLTVDATGGFNTKLDYATITPLQILLPAGFTGLSWGTAATSPIPRSEAQRAVVDNKMYVFGGYPDPSATPTVRADMYNPAADTWTQLPDLPEPFSHAGMAVEGHKIYMAGGYLGPGGAGNQIFGSSHLWVYDIDAKTYTPGPDLPEARGASAMVILNHTLHFFGGADLNRHDSGTHWTLPLDGKTAAWGTAAPLLDPRNHLGCGVINGRIYAVGGEHGQNTGETPIGTLEVWDPAHPESWQLLTGLHRGRSHIAGATFVQDNRLLVMGGEASFRTSVADVDAYDPLSNTWTTLTPLPTTRNSGVAESLLGRLYYNGKCSCNGGNGSITYVAVRAN